MTLTHSVAEGQSLSAKFPWGDGLQHPCIRFQGGSRLSSREGLVAGTDGSVDERNEVMSAA
jgi:hypothetical protein